VGSPRFWVWLSRSWVARVVGRSGAGLFAAVGVLCAAVLLLPGPWDADPAGAAKADTDPEREVVELRGARSKTFERADGSFETRLTRQSQHWLDRASGEWEEIDSSLVASTKAGVGWESGANRFTVELAEQSKEGLVSFVSHGKRMGFSLEGAVPGRSGAKDATSAVVYRGVYPDVDVEYAVLPDGLKETIVLRKPGAPASYTVRLRPESGDTWRAEQLGERGPWAFFVNGASEPEFVLLPPVVGDSSFETSRLDDPAAIPHALSVAPGMASLEVSEQKDGSFLATVAIDEKWLSDPERVFPVALDPTVYSQPDVADGWYDTVNGGNPSIESTISVGPYGVGSPNRMGVLTFDLASIPPAATVSSATLHMFFENCYPGSCQGNDAGTVRLRRLTAGWSASTPWSAISGQIDATTLATMTFPYPWSTPIQTWRTWSGAALTSALQGMVNGSVANYGLILDESQGNNWNGWWFRSSLWGDPSSAPYLEVGWSSEGVQVDPALSVHSDGAELRWQHYPAGAIPGFKRFEVHRSASAGFTPSAATLIATLTDSALQSYRDTTAKSSSTFWYEVVTVIDPGSGEVSYSSNEVKALLPATGEATVTVQPGFISSSAKGTYISSGSPNTPQGNSSFLVVGSASGSTTRTLLQFDLHSVPTGVTVTDAQLQLYALQSTSASALEAHRISAWWEEGGATWNAREYQGGVNWATPGGDYDAASAGGGSGGTNVHWESIPMTSLVQDWVDGSKSHLGLIVRYGSENGSQPTQSFAADGFPGSVALRPKLVVTFEDDSAAVGPTVAISQPQPGELVKGTVTLKAGALDDGSVEQVEFFDGATPIGSPDTTAPYEVSWVTSGRGGSSLTAKATDEAGNVTTSQAVAVTRANSAAPSTSVSSATPGGGGAWTVNAAASDDVAVSKVEFFVDGDRFASDEGSPYSASLQTLSLPVYDGSHTLTTKAYDEDGNVTVSSGYPISVANTSGSRYQATIATTDVPLEMAAGTTGGGGGGGGGSLGFDALTKSGVFTTGTTFSHTPVGTPRGVVVFVAQNGSATDENGTVTYGGVALGKQASPAADTLTEPMLGYAYFLGSGIPTGTQTVALSGFGSSSKVAWVLTLTAGSGMDTAVEDYGVAEEDQANPAVTLTTGASVETYAATLLVSGFGSTGAFAAGSGITKLDQHDFGQQTAAVADTDTNDAGGGLTTQWNTGGSVDDVAMAALAIKETTAGGAGAVYPVEVSLSNTSGSNWPSATTKLRYRWFSADATPTVVDSGDVSIGADLGAGQQRNVTLEIEPPQLPTGVLRARYRLQVDLYDTATSSYFATNGNKPHESWVTVTDDMPVELGLERYQAYDDEELGGGLASHVNLANGNSVVSWTPLSEPGRGIDTVVNLTYNSLEHGSVSPLGNNWSLAISSLTPFGLPLDIHPNAADTAAGRTDKWVGLTDGDGSYHRFEGNAAGTYHTAPAGVELYLKQTGTGWELWKPDRTRFVYDAAGYPTKVADANGNELTYSLATPAAGEDPYGIGKRVTAVTDAGGRDFTLTYWAKADTPTQAMRGKLKTLTDHVGHVLEFTYYEDGNLRSITEKGGPGDDGMPTPDRTGVFAYLNTAGTGPAIGTLAGRQHPFPGTTQSPVLFSVIDFKGQETQFEYATSGANTGRLLGRTNRLGGSTNKTTYAYPSASSTTVTLPLSREWQYTLDSEGKVTEIVDPFDQSTQVEWTASAPLNHVHKLVQPTGEFTEYAYNPNGLLVSEKDELGNETTYTYANSAIDANDVTGNWETGRAIGHISQLASLTKPRGNATTGNPSDYTWTFTYTASPGDTTTGLVKTITDPLGNITTNTWNANATLATQTLPANGTGSPAPPRSTPTTRTGLRRR
jgi:YD repeat-containing protein